MANETKQIPVVGKVGEVSISPRVMQKNKPEPDTLQKQGAKTLTELLEEKKPKKVLIVTDDSGYPYGYHEMLSAIGKEHLGRWISEPQSGAEGAAEHRPWMRHAYKEVAKILATACSEAGIEAEIMQVSREGEVEEVIMDLRVAIKEVGKLMENARPESAQEKAILIETAGRLLAKAAEMSAIARGTQKTSDITAPADVAEELKKHDADLVLHAPGCLCCVSEKDTVDTLREKFVREKVFLLLPTPNSPKSGIRSFSDEVLFSL